MLGFISRDGAHRTIELRWLKNLTGLEKVPDMTHSAFKATTLSPIDQKVEKLGVVIGGKSGDGMEKTVSAVARRINGFLNSRLSQGDLAQICLLEPEETFQNLTGLGALNERLLPANDFNKIYRKLVQLADELSATHPRTPILKQLAAINNSYSQSGMFPSLASTLAWFTIRLFQLAVKSGYQDLFFLSREGQFLKSCFDSLQDLLGTTAVRTHYLKVSRRATYVAALSGPDDPRTYQLLNQYSATSVGEFLASLGFSADQRNLIGSELGIALDVRIPHLGSSAEIERIKSSSLFKATLNEIIAEQKALLRNYLRTFERKSTTPPIVLVDVGWKGSIQDFLFCALDQQEPITGLYLGITERGGFYHPSNKKVPILFSMPERTEFRQAYNENRPIFEIILGADHGSIEKYTRNPAGAAEPIEDWQEGEKKLFKGVIEPFQRSLSNAINQHFRIILGSPASDSEIDRTVAKLHARGSFTPSREEIDFFQNLTHFENFGVFEFANYIKPIRKFSSEWYANISALRNNFFLTISRDIWPALTLRNMNLGFLRPLYGWGRYLATFYPYHRILKGYLQSLRKGPGHPSVVARAEQERSVLLSGLEKQSRMLAERKEYIEKLISRAKTREKA